MINFHPPAIEPNLKQLGRDQKRILRQMARHKHIISLMIVHDDEHKEDICLQDEDGSNCFQKIESLFLESMGKRGLFIQEVFTPSLHQTIVKFRLKSEVRNHFVN